MQFALIVHFKGRQRRRYQYIHIHLSCVIHIVGAVTAMHDAIALANLFYAMPAKTSEDVTKIFEQYQMERLPAVTESFNNSRQLAKISEKGFVGSLILYLSTHMPIWLWRLGVRLFSVPYFFDSF